MTLVLRAWERASLVFFVLMHLACLLGNHHFYMSSARQGFFWWEIDITYYTLRLLSWLHVIRDLKEPPAWALEHDPGARDVARRMASEQSAEARGARRPMIATRPWEV